MFKNLTNLGYRRTGREAVGFYLAYIIFIGLLGALLAAVTVNITGTESFDLGFSIGNFVAVVIAVVLSFALLNKKKLLNNFVYILLALLSGVLAYFGGGLLGLIPVAYLTTK